MYMYLYCAKEQRLHRYLNVRFSLLLPLVAFACWFFFNHRYILGFICCGLSVLAYLAIMLLQRRMVEAKLREIIRRDRAEQMLCCATEIRFTDAVHCALTRKGLSQTLILSKDISQVVELPNLYCWILSNADYVAIPKQGTDLSEEELNEQMRELCADEHILYLDRSRWRLVWYVI